MSRANLANRCVGPIVIYFSIELVEKCPELQSELEKSTTGKIFLNKFLVIENVLSSTSKF